MRSPGCAVLIPCRQPPPKVCQLLTHAPKQICMPTCCVSLLALALSSDLRVHMCCLCSDTATMCRLSQGHGRGCLQRANLDGVAIDLEQQRASLLKRCPAHGTLAFSFRSQCRPPQDTKPLSDSDFANVWTRCVHCSHGAVHYLTSACQ